MNMPIATAKYAPISVRPLRLWHLPVSFIARRRAFVEDPVGAYLETEHYRGPLWQRLFRATFLSIADIIFYLVFIFEYSVFQVGGGRSVAYSKLGTDEPQPENPVLVMLQKLARVYKDVMWTQEQQFRRKETQSRMQAMIKRALGDKVYELDLLELLFTDPKAQGQGWASALVKHFTSRSDIRGRRAWLMSSNYKNDDFYQSHGFTIIDCFLLGDDNPRWQKKPVLVTLMVREPSAAPEV